MQGSGRAPVDWANANARATLTAWAALEAVEVRGAEMAPFLENDTLPWLDQEGVVSAKRAPARWVVSLAPFAVNALQERYLAGIGAGPCDELPARVAWLASFIVDSGGRPSPSSLQVSLGAWSLIHGAPMCTRDFEAVDRARREIFLRLRDAAAGTARADWLRELAAVVASEFGLPEPSRSAAFALRALRPKETPDILDSFFARDLLRVSQALQSAPIGPALAGFLQADPRNDAARVDVNQPESASFLQDALHPRRMPRGCWPSAHALAFGQQLAVNEIRTMLRGGAGLLGVNGPPGTGKTTLLRDLVAAVVTDRAAAMVSLEDRDWPGDAGTAPFALPAALRGQAIVVASSNNGAVENITRELPLAANVAFPGETPDYYLEVAKTLFGPQAWGLIAAPLGNKANCLRLADAFMGAPDDVPSVLRELSGASGPDAECEWRLARQAFDDAIGREQMLRDAAAERADTVKRIVELTQEEARCRARHAHIEEQADQLATRRDVTLRALEEAEQQIDRGVAAVLEALDQSKVLLRSRPSWRSVVSSLGGAYLAWRRAYRGQHAARAAANRLAMIGRRRAAELSTQHARDLRELDRLGQQASAAFAAGDAARRERAGLETTLHVRRAVRDPAWLFLGLPHDERERQRPWFDREWMLARQEVFACALRVHRAFAARHAALYQKAAPLILDFLTGRPQRAGEAALALDTLSLLVPVFSTTFASVARLARNVGAEEIGWLLIDEAGQAIPQAAAGIIWRARRVVALGDPSQLEPVVTIEPIIERAVATAHALPTTFWPSKATVQGLADAATPTGAHVADFLTGAERWAGFPLWLHRRCMEPMFSISNTVAYGGRMVQAVAAADTSPLPVSCWIDSPARGACGHWLRGDEPPLRRLLMLLSSQGVDLSTECFLLTPFRSAADALRRLARSYGIPAARVGTVHTAQGKEARIVIFVLGGDPARAGARAWAASSPNLLNVAVTRAKERLYVIGDHAAWASLSIFGVLARKLPLADPLNARVATA